MHHSLQFSNATLTSSAHKQAKSPPMPWLRETSLDPNSLPSSQNSLDPFPERWESEIAKPKLSWRTSWSTTLHPVMYTKHQLVSRETKPRGFCRVATSQQGPPVARATAQPREGPADRPALQSQHWASGWHGPANRASFASGHRGDRVAGYSLALTSAARFKRWRITDLGTSPKKTLEAPQAGGLQAALTLWNLHIPGITTDVLAEWLKDAML